MAYSYRVHPGFSASNAGCAVRTWSFCGSNNSNGKVPNVFAVTCLTFVFLSSNMFFCRRLRALQHRKSRWKFVKFVEHS